MRTFCLTLPETPERTQKAVAHFQYHGVVAEFFFGLSAEVAGLSTTHTYEIDAPGSGFRIGSKPTGIWLAHWILWSALQLLPDEHFLILEVDVRFDQNWKEKFDRAMRDVPKDFDFLFLGSCCCADKPKTLVKGEVWDVKWPCCLHAYVLSRKCIPYLLTTLRKIWAPIDLQLPRECFPKLKVYTVLPRIADQFNMELAI